MKLLFVYKFLTLGGVEVVLRTRLDQFDSPSTEAEVWFLQGGDGSGIFRGVEDRVHIGSIHRLSDYLGSSQYDLIATIDTPEVFELNIGSRFHSTLLVESHTPYEKSLRYLSSIPGDQVSAIFVPTEYQAMRISSRIGSHLPVSVVPNPIDAIFLGEIQGPAVAPRRPIIAWVGRLDHVKNWAEFISVAGALKSLDVEADYWIVGRPPNLRVREELYRKVRSGGLLDRFRWLMNVPHEHLPRLLDVVRASGGVLVSTSRGESFGMAAAEAMARECAVVLPRTKPFVEYAQSGMNAELYEPGSAHDAARKIAFLLRNQHARQRLGSNARATIRQLHDPQATCDMYVSAARAVIEHRDTLRGSNHGSAREPAVW